MFLLTFITLINCQKEDLTADVEQVALVKPIFQQRMVSLSEIPKIKKYIINNTNANIFSLTTDGNAGANEAIFDEENILEIIDTLNNANYSFNFRFPDTPIGEFYNLVVGKSASGGLKTPFVLKYKCDESQLETYIASGLKFSSFKGAVSFHKYTDFFEVGTFNRVGDTNCPPQFDEAGDPVPCEIQPIDGTGNGTGSGGDGINGEGSSAPSTSDGSQTCTYLGIYVINCGGTNSNTLHPYGECGRFPDKADQYDIWECLGSGDLRVAPNAKVADCPDCTIRTEGAIGANNNSMFMARATLLSELTLSDTAKNWVNNPNNNTEVIAVYNYLDANRFDGFYAPEAKAFAENAIEAWVNGGEVNFENRLIYNPIIAQDYRTRMSDAEIAIFDTLNTLQKEGYLRAATQAYIYAETHFPRPVRNRKGDAFKHTFWNALSTVYIGETLTEQLTTAHEDIEYDPNYPNHFKETQMDIHNNAQGRQIAYGAGRLYQLVQNALDNGGLRYLSNLEFSDGFWRATDNSQLIPTNQ